MLKLFFQNGVLTWINYVDFICRILVSLLCGALIGQEREKRLKNAGLRTHIIACVAACLMMIVSKYGFMDVVTLTQYKMQADVSRVAHGVVSAIGFLGAGVIFVKHESVVGLTTAAGLWAIVGIGITIGAGMYVIGIFSTILILLVQKILHNHHNKSRLKNSGHVVCNLTKHGFTFKQFNDYMDSINAEMREISIETDPNDNIVVSADVMFTSDSTMTDLINNLQLSEFIDSVQVFPTV